MFLLDLEIFELNLIKFNLFALLVDCFEIIQYLVVFGIKLLILIHSLEHLVVLLQLVLCRFENLGFVILTLLGFLEALLQFRSVFVRFLIHCKFNFVFLIYN